jgi:hypothetical protein
MVERPLTQSLFSQEVTKSLSSTWKEQTHNSNTTSYVGQKGISGAERKSRLRRNATIAAHQTIGGLAGGAPGYAIGVKHLARGKTKSGMIGLGAGAVGQTVGMIAGQKHGARRAYPGYTMGAFGLKKIHSED